MDKLCKDRKSERRGQYTLATLYGQTSCGSVGKHFGPVYVHTSRLQQAPSVRFLGNYFAVHLRISLVGKQHASPLGGKSDGPTRAVIFVGGNNRQALSK